MLKTALITGGISGLGRATAVKLDSEGYNVAVCDLHLEEGEIFVATLKSAIFIQLDVTDEQQVKDAIDQTVERFGDIHLVLNSAGIAAGGPLFTNTSIQSTETLETLYKVNVAGTFNISKYAALRMSKQPVNSSIGARGVIFMISSVQAFEGNEGLTSYSATKGAISGMTVPMARDLGKFNIRVITIAPGFIWTRMTENLAPRILDLQRQQCAINRLGEDTEFADSVFLLSQCTFINGAIIRLDGCIRVPKL